MRPLSVSRRAAHTARSAATAAVLAALAVGDDLARPTEPRVPSRVGLATAALASNGRIAFASTRAGTGHYDVFVMNADGSNLTNLTPGTQDLINQSDIEPAWSPDGKRIAFSSVTRTAASDTTYQIVVMNADGSGREVLTNTAEHNRSPDWSPDGSRIAYVHVHYEGVSGGYNEEIHVMDADGANDTRITHRPGQDIHPDWSPDGTKIAYGAEHDRNSDIYVMKSDGTLPTRLTDSPGGDFQPAWSPDGTRIAFTRQAFVQGGQTIQTYVMNADGSVQTNVTGDPGFGAIDPAWSPDGTKIVVAGGSVATFTSTDVWVMNADGSGRTQIIGPDDADDINVAWQPIPAAATFPFSGFFHPVENLPVQNVAKAGRAIPLKFSLGGDRGLAILAAGSPASQPVACAGSVGTSTLDETAAAGASTLSYDPATDQYTYLWKTDKGWTGCRQLTLALVDGTRHELLFAFTK